MESQHFGHQHPLVFDDEQSNPSETAHCSRCGEAMSGPSFSCAECGFYLHKECAEAPSQINHPFHNDHPLCLLPNPSYAEGRFICNFCGERGKMFVYHCSCDIDLHIKCALFTFNIAEKCFGDVQAIAFATKHPSFPAENSNKELENSKCYWCWEPLSDSAYYSLDGGFNLHKKCVELSFEIDYPLDHNHLLTLQFSVEKIPCIVCADTRMFGLSYCCSLCNISIHVACLPIPPLPKEDEGHKHSFTVILRQMSFTCDACGVERNSVPYTCSNCNLLVHKKCISLPPIIKFAWHEHPLFHSYFITTDNSESKNWDCVVCLDEVNTKHGSYYCSECHFIVHVNCVTENKDEYSVIESVEKFYENRVLFEASYVVIERKEGEEVSKIKHFSHEHDLMLSDKSLENDEFCDGCTLLISDSFYHCSECSFFLHKKCVEFPKKKYFWFHSCDVPFILVTDNTFKCSYCSRVCNGFGYECHECGDHLCLQCPTLLTLTCEGHEHPLSYLHSYRGLCTCCSKEMKGGYMCKICKFALCFNCIRQPAKVRNKCDKHLLTLTYKDDNTYSESHFCDICEYDRNPNCWFYHCTICDTSVEPRCVHGRGVYAYIKDGKLYEGGQHPHPLRFVKNRYYYLECSECHAPCKYLALECMEPGCGYIVHWRCIRPDLSEL